MTPPSDDYLWDRSGAASGGNDPDVARLEELMAPLRHDAPLDEVRLSRGRRDRSKRPVILGAMVAACAALALIVWWRWPGGQGDTAPACVGFGFTFNANGDVTCNGSPLAAGVLPIGGTLSTGTHEAELAIANIGTAKLGTDTVVRLERTEYGKKHQLFLQQGKMHAWVNAPPKIFAVATPSADVTDLGCEYTLDIDKQGAGSIVVLTGRVELETGSHQPIIAPAGTHARLLPGRRASMPIANGASAALEAAIAEFDAGKPDALTHVLAAAKVSDGITFVNLMRVVSDPDKRRVLQRLAELQPAPQCVTVDDALADNALLEMWLDEVYLVAIGASEVHAPCK